MAYGTAQKTYHWLSAALVAVMAGTGLAYSYDLADGGAMRVHQITGQALIALLVLRIGTRLVRGGPGAHVGHAGWERMLSRIVHLGLYAALIALVVTGYVSASAETDNALLAPVDLAFARSDTGEAFLDTHYLLKWVLLTFFALHLAGALKHHFVDRDATLKRMINLSETG